VYVHLGDDVVIRARDVVAIVDLAAMQRRGLALDKILGSGDHADVTWVGDGVGTSLVVTADRLYVSPISPMTLFHIIMGIIGTLQLFTQGYVFAEGNEQSIGGPENSLLFYAIYLYQTAFSFLKMGYASAMAWMLFLIVLVLTLIVFRTSAKWVYYGGER